MSHWISNGIGNVQAGEADLVVRPKFASPVKRGILYIHGREAANGGAWEWQKFIERATLISKLAAAGYVVVSADLGGNTTWGNSTAISRISAAATYLLTLGVLPDRIALFSQSMGSLNSLAWAAANPTLVAAIVGMIPVVDLTDIHTNNRNGFTSEINTAYGGTYSEASFGATHNPTTMASAGAYAGMLIQLWYGDSDAIALPGTVTAFKAAVGANCSIKSMSGGHFEATMAAVDLNTVINAIEGAG